MTPAYDSLKTTLKKDVKLMVVSKSQPCEAIRPLLEKGHRLFGENRLQEALKKWPTLKEQFPDIELHLIGPLQTNKVKEAVLLFDCIQTLDRPKLIYKLKEEFSQQKKSCNVFIQVNVGREPQKAGVALEDLQSLVTLSQGLPIKGLMTIPPVTKDPRPYFRFLSKTAA
ncbi:MAG: YggS family pyridoxal phosphate-dependent enzyme [Proteobacteria bacterium]|nr:YggS family pyridoxal phosphate-dependent enzyme [Pseudomonadota bacterium]